jgi:hypothetical protein
MGFITVGPDLLPKQALPTSAMPFGIITYTIKSDEKK